MKGMLLLCCLAVIVSVAIEAKPAPVGTDVRAHYKTDEVRPSAVVSGNDKMLMASHYHGHQLPAIRKRRDEVSDYEGYEKRR